MHWNINLCSEQLTAASSSFQNLPDLEDVTHLFYLITNTHISDMTQNNVCLKHSREKICIVSLQNAYSNCYCFLMFTLSKCFFPSRKSVLYFTVRWSQKRGLPCLRVQHIKRIPSKRDYVYSTVLYGPTAVYIGIPFLRYCDGYLQRRPETSCGWGLSKCDPLVWPTDICA